MSQYNIIISTSETTVVSEYEPQQTRSDAYQSEAALEAASEEEKEKILLAAKLSRQLLEGQEVALP